MATVDEEDIGATSSRDEGDWVPNRFCLRNAWFPLAHTFEVGERASRWQIYSQPCYLWRARGRVHASRRHPELPAAGPAAGLPADAAGSYPVVERFGYVWIWYGDPEDASDALVPDVPFLPREGGLPVRMQGNMRLDCCTPLFLENLLDLTHADYLHANLLGDERSDQDRVEVRFASETVTMIRRCTHKSIAPITRWFGGLRATYQDVHVAIHVHVRSSVAIAYGRYTPDIDLPIFHPCVPESRDRCRLSFALNMTRAPWLLRALMPLTPYIVLPQDNRMVGPQSTRYRDAGERRDLHSRLDRAGPAIGYCCSSSPIGSATAISRTPPMRSRGKMRAASSACRTSARSRR
ncbi:oxygenase [Burkholderia thailandensis]|nr:oxygenase [Burkholderia thailandensis]